MTAPESGETEAHRTILRAAEEVRGWPECYAEALGTWLEIAAAESHSGFYGPLRPHPAFTFAVEVLADARKAAIRTSALNQARRR